MADDVAVEPAPGKAPRPIWLRWLRRLFLAVLALVALLVAAVVVLDSSIGHRFVIDRIAAWSPRSGLRVEIGRIDGSLFRRVELRDVEFRDPHGRFLSVPRVELDWRPLAWFERGLDIRDLAIRRARLQRLPKLRPGDPNSPTLPGFDIRVDRLMVENLQVEPGVLGPARRVDLLAKANIRNGRVLLDADGQFGREDRVVAKIDSEPDRDKFDVAVRYEAHPGGMLSVLTGIPKGLRIYSTGKGSWSNWRGALLVRQEDSDLGAFRVTNNAGIFHVLGLAHPQPLLSTANARITGQTVPVDARFSFHDRVLSGKLATELAAAKINVGGKADFARNTMQSVVIKALVTRPELLTNGVQARGARIALTLDGAFNAPAIAHTLDVDELRQGTLAVFGFHSEGTARLARGVLTLPLNARAARIVTGNPQFDPRLVNLRLTGPLTVGNGRVDSPRLSLVGPGLAANLTLAGNTRAGDYHLSGPIAAQGVALTNIGTVSASARIDARFGRSPWRLAANVTGRLSKVANATVANIAGANIRFTGRVALGAGQPIDVAAAQLNADRLALSLSGRRMPDGRTTLNGNGRHTRFGAFKFDATIDKAGPQAVLVLESPLPAAQLSNVRVALSPIDQGFHIETTGGSMLGPFAGTARLYSLPRQPLRVEIEQLDISDTRVSGSVLFGDAGVSGKLAFAGGGVTGTADLAPEGGAQRINAHLTAKNAHFNGDPPISLATGQLDATGLIASGRTTIDATLTAHGLNRGQLSLNALSAKAHLENGEGTVTAAIEGRRLYHFALVGEAQVAENRIAALVKGTYANLAVSMPRRAVLTRVPETDGGGWQIDPTQVNIGKAMAVAKGRIGGQRTDLTLGMLDLPLLALDPILGGAGLGGDASGLIEYHAEGQETPTGTVRLKVKGLTRAGLLYSSRPLDVAIAGVLDANQLGLRAVMADGARTSGRLQARIDRMPADGDLITRLRAGALFAQLRYDGPADALWRLTGVDELDLTGDIAVAADVTGVLDNPQVHGSLAGKALRLQSAPIGADVRNVSVNGAFSGSRLVLTSFSGSTDGGGTLSGSGMVDLTNLTTRGLVMDIKAAAHDAQLIDLPNMGATVTGPLRIVADGPTGTIAGRVSVSRGRWQLGGAQASSMLPNIHTIELNAPGGQARTAPPTRWRFLIDATASNRIDVRGLGLDSEWSARVHLRGALDNPAITGSAELVRGGYEFAGKRFDLTRGRITFNGEAPPDPQLDIIAESDVDGIDATITIVGTALRPEITFSSTPALPEEELLSRLLFGTSITDISAPEALQLGAALASLRGGGGMDPINRLRGAIGLDRLRVISADPTEDRGTSVAAGKYIGRRIYLEIVTDGQGYSATQAEFRVTRWLSLLATVNSLGRESINARISRDY